MISLIVPGQWSCIHETSQHSLMSKQYLRLMKLATSSTRRKVNCEGQPLEEMDGQGTGGSSPGVRQHHHVPWQVEQFLYFLCLETNCFMIRFALPPLNSTKIDLCSLKNSYVIQWINWNSSLFCRKWSEFKKESFYRKIRLFKSWIE